jgi:protein tyrosine phosphatase (PTP) superfamily phosphohydrolase (DUF442 family)
MFRHVSIYRFWLARFFAGACAVGVTTFTCAATGDPVNFVHWRPGLASSAQPNADYLRRARALGFEVVINLAPPEYPEAVETEGAILGAQGVTYLNLPVNFASPTAEDFRVFDAMMKAVEKKSVLVHCQVNLRGTSFTFLYRVIHEGATVDESRAKLNSVWAPNPTWKKFIESTLAANGKKEEIF